MEFIQGPLIVRNCSGIAFRRIEFSRNDRFRYGYLCRLIDDEEIQGLPPALRSRVRRLHKAAYWKSVVLLRRDAEEILRLRRERMAAKQDWDFNALVSDHARIQTMVAKLIIAGISHSLHLGAGLESARRACLEFESLLSTPASAQPATA